MDFEYLNDCVLDWEVCSILVPLSYGLQTANEIVLQLNKKINKVSVLNDYFFYPQFKCPIRCLRKIKMLNDIKVLQIKRLQF